MTDPEPTPPFVPYVPGPTNPAPLAPTHAVLDPPTFGIPAQPPTGTLPTHGLPAGLPARRNRTGLIIAAAIVAAVVLVAAGVVGGVMLTSGKSPFGEKTFTAKGALTLQDRDGYTASTSCSGKGGYSDIAEGSAVTISDAAGATVAVGRLGAGKVETVGCTFGFSVPNVPAGKNFYGVEVSHRGVLKFPEDEISKTSIVMSLGG